MRKLIGIFVLCLISSLASAQDFDGYFALGIDVTKPVSNTKWINAPGVGVKAGLQRFVNERWSLGGDFNWGTYSKYFPTETFYQSNGAFTSAFTTDYFKYIYSYNLVLSARHYYPTTNKHFLPFLGLGLGGSENKYTIYYNRYSDQTKVFGFLARPEAGVLIRFSERRSIGALATIHYDYSTAASSKQGYSNFSGVGISLSVMAIDW
jgi:hypothetical protein